MNLIEAAKQALEWVHSPGGFAENDLRAAIEEAEKQEPVAWAVINGDRIVQLSVTQDPFYPHSTPLYTHASTACKWPKGRCACDEVIHPEPIVPKKQEPVAWISTGGDVSRSKKYMDEMGFKCEPLYTNPAPAVPEGWQPIDTAPWDIEVLVTGISGYCKPHDKFYINAYRVRGWHQNEWNDATGTHLSESGWEPTHWMPLPTAPKFGEKE